MSTRYAYSYDREDYTGSFATPEEAVEVARQNSEGVASPPMTIYVGELVEADPQATDHAGPVIHAMRQRALVDMGDVAKHYLKHVSKAQVKQLDGMLEQAVLSWLRRNGLMPKFVTVRAIQEFPISISQTPVTPGTPGTPARSRVSSKPAPRPIAQFQLKDDALKEAWCSEGAD